MDGAGYIHVNAHAIAPPLAEILAHCASFTNSVAWFELSARNGYNSSVVRL